LDKGVQTKQNKKEKRERKGTFQSTLIMRCHIYTYMCIYITANVKCVRWVDSKKKKKKGVCVCLWKEKGDGRLATLN
jgi:hypothetical protein